MASNPTGAEPNVVERRPPFKIIGPSVVVLLLVVVAITVFTRRVPQPNGAVAPLPAPGTGPTDTASPVIPAGGTATTIAVPNPESAGRTELLLATALNGQFISDTSPTTTSMSCTAGDKAVLSHVDRRTGEVRWSTEVPSPLSGVGAGHPSGQGLDPIVLEDDAVVYGFDDNAGDGVAVLDLATGAPRWQWFLPEMDSFLADAKSVLVSWDDGRLLSSLDVRTGSERWTIGVEAPSSLENHVEVNPIVGDEGSVFVSRTGSIRAFDRSTGTERWSSPADGDIPATLIREGPALFVGGPSSRMSAVEPSSGRQLWARDVGGRGARWLPTNGPLIHEGVVMVTGGGPTGEAGMSVTTALSVADGTTVWSMTSYGILPIDEQRPSREGRISHVKGGFAFLQKTNDAPGAVAELTVVDVPSGQVRWTVPASSSGTSDAYVVQRGPDLVSIGESYAQSGSVSGQARIYDAITGAVKGGADLDHVDARGFDDNDVFATRASDWDATTFVRLDSQTFAETWSAQLYGRVTFWDSTQTAMVVAQTQPHFCE